MDDDIISDLVSKKFVLEYSPKLGKKVYVLKNSVPKPVFQRHRKLFGRIDIGWTVKHPRHLARVLYIEGIW